MSYPDQLPARRPAAVTLAAALLTLMAVAAVAYAAVGLAVLGRTLDDFRSAAEGTSAGPDEIDGVALLVGASIVAAAVLSLLAGLLLAALVPGLRAGRPGVRVATWVVCGLGLLFGCCGLAVLIGQQAAPLRFGADDRATAELFGLVADAHPSWWVPLGAGLSIGQVLGYLVVAVLLTLPAANAWFRRRRPAPVPPVAPHHQPTTPAAPPAQPPASSAPQQPSAPPWQHPAPPYPRGEDRP